MVSPIGDALSGGRECGYVLLVSLMSSRVLNGTYDDRRGIISAVPMARQSQLTCLAVEADEEVEVDEEVEAND